MQSFPMDSIDALIAQRLPDWFRQAAPDQRTAFHQALRREQESTERLGHLLRQIPALDEFAVSLLTPALRKAGLADPDPRRIWVAIEQSVELPSAASKLYAPRFTYHSRQSALAAALHNYHQEETKPSIFRKAQLQNAQGVRLALSFEDFVRLCRQVDIGGAYQHKIASVLLPAERPGHAEGHARQAVERLFEDSLRARMEAAVRMAALKGALDEASYRQALPITLVDPNAQRCAGVVTPCQLWLLGKRVAGVVTLELRSDRDAPVEGVVAWIPGDPQQAVGWHRSWASLYRSLASRLRQQAYRRFFARFIKEEDRLSFDRALAKALSNTAAGAPVELDGRHFVIPGDLFQYLRAVQMESIVENARALAVPTGDEDMASRHARLQEMKSAGFSLLGLAGMFVPVLGELLLLECAVELAEEVFDGYRSWRLGDRQGALDHVYGVAQNLFVTGALAGVVHGFRRVPFVDDLHPRVKDGQARLAHDPDQPHGLRSAGHLLEGLAGSEFTELLESEADDLLAITGLSIDQLRRLRVENGPVPARLLDTKARFQAYKASSAGSQTLLSQIHIGAAPGESSQAQTLLIGQYHDLTWRGAQEVLEQSSSDQVDALLASSRVPLAMAQRVRQYLYDSRLDRACLGLRLRQAVNADTEKLALGLIGERAPWPGSVRVELRVGNGQGLLLAAAGPQEAGTTHCIVKGEHGYRLLGELAASSLEPEGGLMTMLLRTMGPAQMAQIGPRASVSQLSRWLLEQARDNRQQLARLLGMESQAQWRLPRRFADGRLGYALSGRPESSTRAIRRGIHQIYPTLSEEELDTYLRQARGGNTSLWSHYVELQQQLSELRSALSDWQGRWRNPLDLLRRRRVADTIRRCWRRKLVGADGEYELVIDGEPVGELPTLPASIDFSHVRRLVLRKMNLEALDPAFLRRFANLDTLDLHGNQLTTVPAGLRLLRRLRHLTLSGNQIVASPLVDQRLAGLSRLEVVEVGGNPMGRCPALAHLPNLRHLGLRLADLTEAPDPVREMPWRAYVNARDNGIRRLRQNVHGMIASWRRLNLHGNPLDPASEQYLEQLQGSGSHRPMLEEAVVRRAWTRTADKALRGRREATWNRLREEPDSQELFHFLAHLADSDDFIEHAEHLQRRIWRILDACEQSEAVREHLFRVQFGTATCDDRPVMVLNQLEVGLLVLRGIEDVPPAQLESRLVQLGRSFYRLDLVDTIARQHIDRLRAAEAMGIDELEIILAYRLRMAKRYHLPIELDRMHHPSFAKVRDSDLLSAQNEIARLETPEAIIDSLAQRPFWHDYVQQRYADRFDALVEPFQERLAKAAAAAEAAGQEQTESARAVREFDYVQESERLRLEYESARRALMRALAREAYERHPA